MRTDSIRLVAAGDLLETAFGNELVVLNLRDGVYYSLRDVGTRVWRLLQQPVTIAALRDVVVSEYEVAADRCEEDLRAFLRELESRGLVEVTG